MHKIPLVALLALAAVSTPTDAQTFRDRLSSGAERLRDGAGQVADSVERSVTGSVDLLTDEATPEETRAELDVMALNTLQRLFAEQPAAARLFEESAGYAVFDTRRLSALGLAAGVGRGVAVSRTTGERVYMNMGTGGVGVSLGIGGFETQVVMLFQTDAVYENFVTQGYDATAEAGTMFDDDKTRGAVRFSDGRSIFYLTNKGWKVSASAAGTKYWRDIDLN
jgi:X-X-X-Leu-X-X-Gly heptad repeat protein